MSTIREMREHTGLTQKEFADRFGIPVGTVRRWEYGESTPAPYLIRMMSRQLPCDTTKRRTITGKDGKEFFYDSTSLTIEDERGTKILLPEGLEGVKDGNLALYVQDLFDSYYEILGKFVKDCNYDRSENIIWS